MSHRNTSSFPLPTLHMSSQIKKIRSLALLCAGLSVAPLFGNQYWDQYGAQAVSIQQNNNGAVQTLKFVDYKDGMLIAQLDGGVGEISLPVNDYLVSTLRLNLGSLSRVPAMMEQQNYVGVLTLLRPTVYPLIKFHKVPDSFTQLHTPIQTLFEALLKSDNLEEAQFLLSKLDLPQAPNRYSQIAIGIMNAYLAKGNYSQAAQIAQNLPVSGQYASNIRPVIDAADALRGAGEYEAVIPLYQRIEGAVADNLKGNVRMWLAYSLVLADRVDEASPMIDAMEQPDPKDRQFSLYQLLHGSRAHRQGDYNLALDVLTRGFVKAQASYAWVPEMLYLIGDCYARSAKETAARNVWTEIVTLYPNSPWAQRAQESLDQLPPVEPETPSA